MVCGLRQYPLRYSGQKQAWRSRFDSGFNPWWNESRPCRFKSCRPTDSLERQALFFTPPGSFGERVRGRL